MGQRTGYCAGMEHTILPAGVIVAAGGLLYHYNPPYGDIYMEVAASHRRCGYGSYLVQELKRTAYELGKIPAARCNVANEASRRTLQKAGFKFVKTHMTVPGPLNYHQAVTQWVIER